jgi:hypothetical protein
MRAAARGERPAEEMWAARVVLARKRGVNPLWKGEMGDVPEEA